MAKAPKPGSAGTTSGEEKVKAAKQVFTMTLLRPDHPDEGEREVTRSLHLGAISLTEHAIVRKVTSLSLTQWLSDIDEMSLRVIWWVAGRQAGGAFLTLDQAMEHWPDPFTEDSFDIEVDTGEDDDPQS